MYRIRQTTVTLFLALGLSYSTTIAAMEPPPNHEDKSLAGLNQDDKSLAEVEIRRGLEVLRAMGQEKAKKFDQYATSLGFSSAAEAVNAKEGTLLRVYRVSLEKLMGFRKDADPKAIFESAPPTVLVPVIVGNKIRSSFMIREHEQGKKWRIVGQGSSNFLEGKSPKSLVRLHGVLMIPELRLRFLIRETKTDLMLIPVANYTLFKLRQGKEYSAGTLFSILQPMAERGANAMSDREIEGDDGNTSNQSGSITSPSQSSP